MPVSIPRLYAIIDIAHLRALSEFDAAQQLLQAGVKFIQYRDKQASSRELYQRAQRLVEMMQDSGAYLIMNDRADIALLTGAQGLHVGQEDLPVERARALLGPEKIIGISSHSVAQVREAERTTAEYVAIGPVFPTRSKAQPNPAVGLEGLRQARRATRKPLVAVGGITLETACQVLAAGADSVAVIHDLLCAEDIAGRARQYLQLLQNFS